MVEPVQASESYLNFGWNKSPGLVSLSVDFLLLHNEPLKTEQLQMIPIDYLIVSIGQKSYHSVAGFSA